jgi:hypothetical protein
VDDLKTVRMAIAGASGCVALIAIPAGAASAATAGGAGAPSSTVRSAAVVSTTPAVSPDRTKAVCDRVTKASQRVDKVIARINGGADTKGSIAYLQARITKVSAAGHAQQADLLRERLTVRKDRLTLLTDRRTLLASYQADCAHAGPA